jgi:biotin carboxyl carrier protein
MKYKVTLNGRVYEVEVEAGQAMLLDEYEAIAPAAPAAPAAAPAAAPVAAPAAAPAAPAAPAITGAGEAVNAPMPGTILKVNVKQGDAVKAGTVLCVLEAMKMENEILAPKDGTITQVAVIKGAAVDTGAPLVVIG